MAYIADFPRYWADENWQIYSERIEQLFDLYGVNENNKKSLLISSLSEDVYETIHDALYPTKPKEKTYEELTDLLRSQYIQGNSSSVSDRHNFYVAKQNEDESEREWFERIRELALNCKFGSKLGSVLVFRFISGLKPSPILDRLCEEDEDKLTLKHVMSIALPRE